MERGMAVLSHRIMTTLTYRGKNYVQNKEAAKKQFVELTYRRNVYTNRMDDASSSNEKAELNYRGVNYTKKFNFKRTSSFSQGLFFWLYLSRVL